MLQLPFNGKMHPIKFYTLYLCICIAFGCTFVSCCTEIECENSSTPFPNQNARQVENPELQAEYLQVFDKGAFGNSKKVVNGNSLALGFDEKGNDYIFSRVTPTEFFYDAKPHFMECVMEFKHVLTNMSNVRDVFATALRYRDKINLSLWLKGFVGSILNREDGISPFIPLVELQPDFMVSSRAIREARAQSLKPPDKRTCVTAVDNEIGTANGIENKLWYFREDLMVNSHHWYWHLEYPLSPKELLDRSGELFYYMHHSVLARYHAERLSNELPPVIPLDIKLDGIVREPYYSFLEDSNSGVKWADRPPKSRLQDAVFGTDAGAVNIKISDHRGHGNRLTKAASSGRIISANGNHVALENFEGIDVLARAAEALRKSPLNPNYYGDWHNQGHLLIAFVTNPTNLQGEPEIGVMGDTGTAMRDIVFYRWHKVIDNLFVKHKDTLSPYTPRGGEFQLTWPGVTVGRIQVNSVRRKSVPPANTLYTFWTERRFDLSKGLDFQRNATIDGSVDLCVDHLNHDEFQYTITITKSSSLRGLSKATVRIFMAPRLDENNNRYSMEDQRKLFFVLDTFSVYLKSGTNVIKQNSEASSLTLEFVKSLNQLRNDEYNDEPSCGCGWPHHLLIPKGKPSGMIFDLFVMVTNGDNDAVDQEAPGNSGTCSQGYLYCGLMNQKYPDAKPMGYPFYRQVYTVPDFNGRRPVANLEEYVTLVPNMDAVQVNIIHEPMRKEQAQSY